MDFLLNRLRKFAKLGTKLRTKIPSMVQAAIEARTLEGDAPKIQNAVTPFLKDVSRYSIWFSAWVLVPVAALVVFQIRNDLAASVYNAFAIFLLGLVVVFAWAFSSLVVIIPALKRLPRKNYYELLRIFWLNLDLLQIALSLALLTYMFVSSGVSTILPLLIVCALAWVIVPWTFYLLHWDILYFWLRAGQTAGLLLLAIVVAVSPVPVRHYQSWVQRRSAERLRPEAQNELTSQWETLQWFTQEGNAKVWYSGYSTGGPYRLFSAPGYDPGTNERLRPVEDRSSKDTIVAWFRAEQATVEKRKNEAAHLSAQKEEEQRLANIANAKQTEIDRRKNEEHAKREAKDQAVAEFVGSRPTQSPLETTALIVLDENSRNDNAFAQRIAAKLDPTRIRATTTLFSPSFTQSATFRDLLLGRYEREPTFRPEEFAKTILVAEISSATSGNQIIDGVNMIVSDIVCRVRLFTHGTRWSEKDAELRSRGVGFDLASARKMALERLEDDLARTFVSLNSPPPI